MKLERLLGILVLLLGRPRISAQELAERFEVSVRTIYRDVEAISQAGIPVVTYQGSGGGIGVTEGYRIDRSLLTPDELASVLTALRAAAGYRDNRAEAVLEKVKSLFPDSRSPAFQARTEHTVVDLNPWGNPDGLRQKLALLKGAIQSARPVSFTYLSAQGASSLRIVEPYVLVLKSRHWYLYGRCRLRSAFRLFRLSRLKGLAALDERFDRLPLDLDAAPWDQERDESTPTAHLLLRFNPAARVAVEDFFGAENVTPDAQGWYTIRTSFPEDDWVYGFLLSFGPRVEVLQPPHVRERIAQMAAAISAVYRGDST